VWKRTRQSHRDNQDPVERECKQADLDMLECAAAAGEIDLFYADESGFSLWMPVTYSYYFQGRQKRQEQTPSKGRRVSILGLFHPLLGFIYGLVLGSFNSKRYIKMMDEQAQQAHQVLTHTGRIRVIVQDNGPIHTSKAVQQKWPEWQEKGLYMFFLAKYCSEMNPIEGEWHQIKTHELRGRMFENELDLAYAVMDGIDARAKAAGYQAERFKFPSRTPDS
jgi:transposase